MIVTELTVPSFEIRRSMVENFKKQSLRWKMVYRRLTTEFSCERREGCRIEQRKKLIFYVFPMKLSANTLGILGFESILRAVKIYSRRPCSDHRFWIGAVPSRLIIVKVATHTKQVKGQR